MRSFFLFLAVFLTSCSPLSARIPEKITVHEMESFDENIQAESIVIKDKEDIRKFQAGIWGAGKESGAVDLDDPELAFTLGKESYFLWLESGIIMNQKNTHTVYMLTERDYKNIKRIILERNESP
ncbi:hypothetical protein GLV98_01450 [Halobacillus litoralis]|uniref:YhfM-like domain-containing protein n=1 Tax=Halobacillus litoralis TaxID=45668 RepID=A0A845DXR3_9BACI|nr:hypothetical protein [Halobacillus litoralis]MYL48125.1 hypothetical protein [Halobacillus litoralis]